MKNILFLMIGFLCSLTFGQELDAMDSEVFERKNEIRINAFDLVAAGTLGVGYERYLKNNQSISADVYLFDNYSYYDIGFDDYNSNAFSLKMAYNIYFSKKREFKGFFFSPFMRFRAGNLEYKDYYYDINGNYFEYQYEQKLNGFQVGFGIGNK